jgi:hypothetical protein
MGAMNRLVMALVLALSVAATTVSAADAKTPCRNLIYNDWYQDGQIASTYPISCYRDALKHLGTGDQVYTSLQDDIRAAMQAALARQHGKKVAAQVGHKFAKPVLADSNDNTTSVKDEHPDATDPASKSKTRKLASSGVSVASTGTSGGGVPTPLLVLGGLALVLLAAGAAGTLARRRR